MKDLETIENRIKIFWEQQEKFRNHPLLTELPNPDTYNLSELAKTNPKEGIRTIINVDIKAIKRLKEKVNDIELLKSDIRRTIEGGNKVYICGCGASGRLAVSLEYLWKIHSPAALKESVTGILAGGDNAMIKSLEGFEDHKELGIKQLYLAGFKQGDLLIGATASGESPFVLGAVEEAAKISVKPWFIHCNTDESLAGRIKNHVIYNPVVRVMSLFVGQMALSGSTRMQATTALMLGMGLPMLFDDIDGSLDVMLNILQNTDLSGLEDFIIREADIYRRKEFVLYSTEPIYGITVLTDTTERSPTFNLTPFENQIDSKKNPAWCYILLPESENSKNAWESLLGREPRTLEWSAETSFRTLLGFDFSRNVVEYREKYAAPSHFFRISKEREKLCFSFDGLKKEFKVGGISLFFEQVLLKLILNACSTLVMGRMGFYEGNLMTSLYPSNSKLIDRAIRYIDFILKMKENISVPYEEIAENMFEELKKLGQNESIVIKTVERLKGIKKTGKGT